MVRLSLKWIVGRLILSPQIARGTTLAFFEKCCLIIIPATGDDGSDLEGRIIGITAVLELSSTPTRGFGSSKYEGISREKKRGENFVYGILQ